TIAQGLRSSARRTPGKVALREGSRELTFAQLLDRVHRVTNGVTDGLGLAEGDHSAILSWNCLEFIELVAGLSEAETAPALLNPRSTPDEIAFVCDDAEARVLFVHPALEEVARAAALSTVERIIVLGEEYKAWLADARATVPTRTAEEHDVF